MKTDLESPFKNSCFRSAISRIRPRFETDNEGRVTRTGYPEVRGALALTETFPVVDGNSIIPLP